MAKLRKEIGEPKTDKKKTNRKERNSAVSEIRWLTARVSPRVAHVIRYAPLHRCSSTVETYFQRLHSVSLQALLFLFSSWYYIIFRLRESSGEKFKTVPMHENTKASGKGVMNNGTVSVKTCCQVLSNRVLN